MRSLELEDWHELCAVELSVDVLECVLSMRPDLADAYLAGNMFNWDKVAALRGRVGARRARGGARLVRAKASLVLNRLLVSGRAQAALTAAQMAELVAGWQRQRLDAAYGELVERAAFARHALGTATDG